jgi:hypothetical protein
MANLIFCFVLRTAEAVIREGGKQTSEKEIFKIHRILLTLLQYMKIGSKKARKDV